VADSLPEPDSEQIAALVDWQRRLRDLRFLGWDYQHEKRYDEGSRVWTYYRLTRSAAWPENIWQAIRAEEAQRKARKAQLSAGPE